MVIATARTIRGNFIVCSCWFGGFDPAVAVVAADSAFKGSTPVQAGDSLTKCKNHVFTRFVGFPSDLHRILSSLLRHTKSSRVRLQFASPDSACGSRTCDRHWLCHRRRDPARIELEVSTPLDRGNSGTGKSSPSD